MKKQLKVLKNPPSTEEILKQSEDRNDVCFGAMMDSLFELAEELHERDELTEVESVFLEAFDEYVESAVELNELEDEVVLPEGIPNIRTPFEN